MVFYIFNQIECHIPKYAKFWNQDLWIVPHFSNFVFHENFVCDCSYTINCTRLVFENDAKSIIKVTFLPFNATLTGNWIIINNLGNFSLNEDLEDRFNFWIELECRPLCGHSLCHVGDWLAMFTLPNICYRQINTRISAASFNIDFYFKRAGLSLAKSIFIFSSDRLRQAF